VWIVADEGSQRASARWLVGTRRWGDSRRARQRPARAVAECGGDWGKAHTATNRWVMGGDAGLRKLISGRVNGSGPQRKETVLIVLKSIFQSTQKLIENKENYLGALWIVGILEDFWRNTVYIGKIPILRLACIKLH
jgi:hypothetical protein